MSLDVDASRAARTPSERRALIVAVRDASPEEFELDWIEWKGFVDLRKREWHVENARQVIGFANRHPDSAMSTAEGHAYLLVGVEPAALHGVEVVDSAMLEDGVARYLGRDGPRWSFSLEGVESKDVLVVHVEPPRWGDRIYTLGKEFDRYRNGTIFIRRRGKTEQADAEEVRMLERRAAIPAGERLVIDLQWWNQKPRAIRAVDASDEQRDRWISGQRRMLRESFEQARSVRRSSFVVSSITNPIVPSEDEFEAQLEEYLARASDEFLVRCQIWSINHRIGEVTPAIGNLTEHNYAEVMAALHLPGPVSAFLHASEPARGAQLATPPRIDTQRGASEAILRQLAMPPPGPAVPPSPPGASISNSGSADIRFCCDPCAASTRTPIRDVPPLRGRLDGGGDSHGFVVRHGHECQRHGSGNVRPRGR